MSTNLSKSLHFTFHVHWFSSRWTDRHGEGNKTYFLQLFIADALEIVTFKVLVFYGFNGLWSCTHCCLAFRTGWKYDLIWVTSIIEWLNSGQMTMVRFSTAHIFQVKLCVFSELGRDENGERHVSNDLSSRGNPYQAYWYVLVVDSALGPVLTL